MSKEQNFFGTERRRFRPYPEYKDSCLQWLEKIPTVWSCMRLRYLALINPKKNEIRMLDPSLSISFIPMEAIREHGELNLEATKPLRMVADGYTYFRDGDVVVAKITPCFENGKGALAKGLVNGIAFGTTELHVLRPKPDIDTRFLLYLTLSDQFRRLGTAEMYGAAGQKRVPEDFICNFCHPLPNMREQSVISDFLDRETAKIDTLIAKKERLIELLQEKRTALITQAVTKGLNPNVPMKDSGVEWLGKIPAHWDTVRMRFLLAAPLKYGANEAAELDDPELPRYVRITDINENDGLREETFKSLTFEVAKEYLLREEDLLFARSGATAGKSFLYRKSWGACAYAGYLIRARLDTKKTFPEFIRYFTASTSYWQWIASTLIQATIQNVSAERYANLSLPLPAVAEQHAIAAFLAHETAKIDSLVISIREAIDRLKEYRTALISAAVTGKIDVLREVM